MRAPKMFATSPERLLVGRTDARGQCLVALTIGVIALHRGGHVKSLARGVVGIGHGSSPGERVRDEPADALSPGRLTLPQARFHSFFPPTSARCVMAGSGPATVTRMGAKRQSRTTIWPRSHLARKRHVRALLAKGRTGRPDCGRSLRRGATPFWRGRAHNCLGQ